MQEEPETTPEDHGGRSAARRFYLRHEYVVVSVVSSVVYIAIAVNVKILLNWIIGPAWPIACMWFVPPLVRRATGWTDPLPDAPDAAGQGARP